MCQPSDIIEIQIQPIWQRQFIQPNQQLRPQKFSAQLINQLGQLSKKSVVLSDVSAIGIEHDVGYTALISRSYHGDDLGMGGWFSTGERDHLRISFGLYEVIQNIFHFTQVEVEAMPGFGKA